MATRRFCFRVSPQRTQLRNDAARGRGHNARDEAATRGHRVLIVLTQGRFTMSTFKATARDNQTVELLDNPGIASAVCLLGRILISIIFLISGISKVTAPAATIAYVASAGLPFPQLGLVMVELVLAPALVLGYRTRWVAA